MAEHRALGIIRAIKAALLNATRAGENVEIGRATQVSEQDAIDIRASVDVASSPYGVSSTGTIESVIRIFVDLHTRTIEHQETLLEHVFQLRDESHRALLADPTLGKAYVVSIRYQGTDELDPTFAGDRLASLRTVWDVCYHMPYGDPRE